MSLLAAAAPAHAVSWPFIRYTEAEGAPTSAMMGVAQDDSGRVWFASRAGMLCYDGATWATWDATRGLPVTWQRDVVVDHTGTVWALCQTTPVRVSRLEDDRWEPLPSWPGLGSGSETYELVAGRDADGGVALAVLAQGATIVVHARDRWWPVTSPADAGTIHSLAWRGAELLIAAAGGLYGVADPGRADAGAPVARAGLPPGPVYAAVIHPVTGALHVAGRGWYGELADGGLRPQAGADSLRVLEPAFGVDAAIDAYGGLYIGTTRALHYLHPLLGLELLTREGGLVSGGLSDILVDREDSVWITNLRGVNRLASRRLRSYSATDGLLADEVSSVLQRRDGSLILGHAGGLTILGRQPVARPLVAPGRDWSRAMDLYEDARGVLWAAMDRSGLARLGDDGSVRWFDNRDGLHGPVYTVLHDRQGRMWVGTGNGLFRAEGGAFTPIELREAASGRPVSVRRLFEAVDGTLLAATGRHGVVGLKDGRVTFWRGDETAGQASVYALFDPGDGVVWAGTGGGLCRLQDGALAPTTAPAPVISEPVYAITRDAEHRIWFGTAAGVLVWDGTALRRLGVADGLCGAETNRDALTCDAEGRLWIGTDRGVSVYDERLAARRPARIPLWIKDYVVEGVERDAASELRLAADMHELEVRFCAPSFVDEGRLRFSTFLEGADAAWTEPAPNPARTVRYTHLRPGRYRLLVRATDVDGRESATVASAAIVVAPPLREQAWFVALQFAALAGVAWLVGSLVQGRRYAGRLAAEVAARTRDLARSEAAVRDESRRLGAVLASISDGVVAIDANGVITLANPAAAGLTGREAAALAGRPLEDLLPGILADARAAAAGDAGAPAGESAGTHFEYLQAATQGEPAMLECAAAPLAGPDGRAGLVLAFRDTTERRRAEQAAIRTQKLESLGVLAGGIAHDFNNLLTVIMGNASLLEMGCSAEQARPLGQIGTAAARAQRLTAQLLTFARGGSPQKRLVDLRTLLREAATLAVAGTSTSLELDMPDDLWDAEVDAGQVEQVISNLLINARQSMPGGGRVQVVARNAARTEADGEAGRQVEIRVRDEGCGIAAADLERIFEPYFTTKDAGSGLGLAITHSVVARHGGSLRVTSEIGRGSEFTLLLPASRDRASGARAAPAPAVGGSRRLLVLDDEAGVRDLLTQLLARMGHEVVAVADGEAALAAWRAAAAAGRPFDAAIMDLTIPGGLGGRETMARLYRLDPAARGIVTSGYSQDPVMADHRRYGFAAKLAKPFGRDEVAAALQTAMG